MFKEAYNFTYKQLICDATGTRKLRIFVSVAVDAHVFGGEYHASAGARSTKKFRPVTGVKRPA